MSNRIYIGFILSHLFQSLALNIMRLEGVFRLIDFDASVSYLNKQYIGAKYSSAYCPPEVLAVVNSKSDSAICVRTYRTDTSGAPIQGDLPYSLLVAHPSYDMWSLGVTLYQVIELSPYIAIIDLLAKCISIISFLIFSCMLESHCS